MAYDDPALYPNMGGVRAYDLLKFHKSNQNSCFGQVPSCVPGQIVKKGDVLADGPAIHDGGLALGKNMLIAFMPWCGYNYEDSVLISERVVKEDIYTSVHIEEFEVVARDTKLGPEEITRDIPNVGEEMLRNLDESGIIRIGAPVKPEDILVGKITPKGETQLTPEEKLLRAIFGDKARDVKNTSLKVPPGVEGTVIDVKVFNRRSGEKDERTRNIEDYEISRLDAKEQDHIRAITRRLLPIVDGKQIATTLLGDKKGEVLAEAGAAMTEELLMALPVKKLADLFQSKEVNENVGELLVQYDHQIEYIKSIYDSKREKVTEGDDLPPGVIKMVKVHIAIKRKLSVGDKMAGRHGNKGVVSRILPEEDMPFFADGRPVDIVLNPLGVPSRMNIGQIMEVHLGWAARELGRQLAEMVDKGTALQSVRDEVKDIFASPEIAAEVDGMDDEEFRKSVLKLRNGHPDPAVVESFEKGVITLYNGIASKCNALYARILEDCDIDEVIRNQPTVLPGEVQQLIRTMTSDFLTEFYNFLRERGVDVSTSKCVFAGGGSLLLRGMIERGNKVAFPIFVEDIHANARGYEPLYQSEVAANGQQ